EGLQGRHHRFPRQRRRRLLAVRARGEAGAHPRPPARRHGAVRPQAGPHQDAGRRAPEARRETVTMLKNVRAKAEQYWTTTKKLTAAASVWGLIFSVVTI